MEWKIVAYPIMAIALGVIIMTTVSNSLGPSVSLDSAKQMGATEQQDLGPQRASSEGVPQSLYEKTDSGAITIVVFVANIVIALGVYAIAKRRLG